MSALVVYSGVLFVIELRTSQDYARHFFTDIEGPVPFYAVNTSLSVFLLWSTALVFWVCQYTRRISPSSRRDGFLYVSQAAVFLYLGLDDRFKLHEAISMRLGFDDHFVLLAVALAEVFFLVRFGAIVRSNVRAMTFLGLACILFGVMIGIDALVARDARMRLTLEDLAKTWSAFFFFAFAWQLLESRLRALGAGRQSGSSGGSRGTTST